MDSDQRTLDWIKKDRIAGTIAQKPYTMGFVGVGCSIPCTTIRRTRSTSLGATTLYRR